MGGDIYILYATVAYKVMWKSHTLCTQQLNTSMVVSTYTLYTTVAYKVWEKAHTLCTPQLNTSIVGGSTYILDATVEYKVM